MKKKIGDVFIKRFFFFLKKIFDDINLFLFIRLLKNDLLLFVGFL